MTYLAVFIGGLILGAVLVLVINRLRKKDAEAVARELVCQAETRKREDLETLLNQIKDSFKSLSLDTLAQQNKLGAGDLENKKQLIDQSLNAINDKMREDLQRVQNLVTDFEEERKQQFNEVAHRLKSHAEQTERLQETADHLRSALASTKTRGQWGERMAEDVLRLAGFIEGINYRKQQTMDTADTRPDYTFLLPQGLKVNMDVKFPLDNYLRYLEADGKTDKDNYKTQFLRDVRQRIKEVTTRDYINPEEKTVDYVIVFIPNEQVYAFINENDRLVIDEALKNKVILSSPLTLYAILAIIRQALDNFKMEETAAQMRRFFAAFNKQWDNFIRSFDKMGKKLEEAQSEYNNLTSTRRRQLERPLREIRELGQGIPELPPACAEHADRLLEWETGETEENPGAETPP